MNTIVMIGAGGALGAIARHFMNVGVSTYLKAPFPWGTLSVNVLGSFLMGMFIVGFMQVWNPPQEIKLFLITGFLGAFTTFSTFSLDTMTLWQRGDIGGAAVYVAASVVLSLMAVALGSLFIWKLTT